MGGLYSASCTNQRVSCSSSAISMSLLVRNKAISHTYSAGVSSRCRCVGVSPGDPLYILMSVAIQASSDFYRVESLLDIIMIQSSVLSFYSHAPI